MNKFEDLHIWKKSMRLVEQVYLLSNELPNEERFGLISQIKSCSIYIPSNITEGAGRNSKKKFIHFLSIANGSTSELKTQLLLSLKLNFISKDKIEPLINLCNEIQKMNRSSQNKLN
ncbi:four helix bundle protein [uncultured Algibacter sp.]|uniref:four helix bundle protein n=1 Tax=uncultured Algibacter sp. TaxID=298659 RepID=UPI002638B7C0|nr:four helix bundle protein [uncultured Algibacter sp.]